MKQKAVAPVVGVVILVAITVVAGVGVAEVTLDLSDSVTGEDPDAYVEYTQDVDVEKSDIENDEEIYYVDLTLESFSNADFVAVTTISERDVDYSTDLLRDEFPEEHSESPDDVDELEFIDNGVMLFDTGDSAHVSGLEPSEDVLVYGVSSDGSSDVASSYSVADALPNHSNLELVSEDDSSEFEDMSLELESETIEEGENTYSTATAIFDDSEEEVTSDSTIESSDDSIASVSGEMITGESEGTTIISAEYTYDGTTETDVAQIEVQSEPDETTELESISLVLDENTIQEGQMTDATVTASFDDGSESDVTDESDIESSDSNIASMSGDTVIGEDEGSTMITAEYTYEGDTETDTASIGVGAIEIQDISLELDQNTIEENQMTDATVTASFDDGSESDVTDESDIQSFDNSVASMSGDTVIGEGEGSTTITAEYTDDNGNTETDTEVIEVEEVDDPPYFETTILDISNPVEAGDNVDLSVEVENIGDIGDTQSLTFSASGIGSTSTTISLNDGESTTESLQLSTTLSDEGFYTGTASTDDDSDSANFEIEEIDPEFTVNIDESNSDNVVYYGDDVEIVTEITNEGSSDTQVVELDAGSLGNDQDTISLGAGESTVHTFSISTDESDISATLYDATVTSDSHSDSIDVGIFYEEYFITGDVVRSDTSSNVDDEDNIVFLYDRDQGLDDPIRVSGTGSMGSYTMTDITSGKDLVIEGDYTADDGTEFYNIFSVNCSNTGCVRIDGEVWAYSKTVSQDIVLTPE